MLSIDEVLDNSRQLTPGNSMLEQVWELSDSRCNSTSGYPGCYRCSRCKIMDVIGLPRDTTTMIKCGKFRSKNVHRSNQTLTPKLNVNMSLTALNSKLIDKNPELLRCGTPPESPIFLSCDPVSNNVAIRSIMDTVGIPTVKILSAFVCRDNASIIEEVNTSWLEYSNSNDQLDPRSLLDQLVMLLESLSRFDFIGCKLDHTSLMITKQRHRRSSLPGSANIHHKLLYLPDTESSITVDGYRIACKLEPGIDNVNFGKLSLIRMVTENGNRTIYCLENAEVTRILECRRHGLLICPGLLEAYCLLISLMMNIEVYKLAVESSAWNRLWVRVVDNDKIARWLTRYHGVDTMASYSDIISALTGCWLRCDVLSVIAEM